jgi:hypothetical protein
VSDQGDRARGRLYTTLQVGLHFASQAFRASGVYHKCGGDRAVADTVQPDAEWAQVPVVAKEAGENKDEPAVSSRQTSAVVDGVCHQLDEFAPGARLAGE